MDSQNDPPNPIRPEFIDKMDPQFVEVYNKYQAFKLQAHHVPISEYRADPAKYTAAIPPGPKPTVGSMTVYNVPVSQPSGEIMVQVYKPTDEAISSSGFKKSAGLPAHINYHGGGWVIGNLASDEGWCRQACQELGIIIVDVDYRLAPEYPYPAQIWDSWEALKWVFDNATKLGVDKSRVSVGGLSAGGHLAAVVTLMARDDSEIPPLKLQLLVVPAVDARWIPIEGSCDPDKVPYETYVSCEYAPCLPLARMVWFADLWLSSEPDKRTKNSNEWIASPILASSHASLAPASIFTAEFDVLRSEGEAYHEKLKEAGTPSTYKMFPGVAHPFGHWEGVLDRGKEYVKDTISVLRQAHSMAS